MKNTKIIAVTSGKGGVGKTSLSLSLSIALAKAGASVTLLDADLGLANTNIMLGISPKYTLQHVLRGSKSLKDITTKIPEGINIISGASGVYELANLSVKQRLQFVNSVADINDDYLILDTGAGMSQNVLDFLMASDEVVVVTTPEPTAIADAYGIIKYIKTNSSKKVVKTIINKIQSISEGKRIAQRINSIAKEFLDTTIENLGFIYEDTLVSKSIKEQRPFIVKYPKSKASGCVTVIAGNILNKSNNKGSGLNNFFKKLSKMD